MANGPPPRNLNWSRNRLAGVSVSAVEEIQSVRIIRFSI
uniref:Hydrolase n=1 Tax=Rhizophora mucronata TaxID=61149 RepID=A0A2P2KQK9_RHIMU